MRDRRQYVRARPVAEMPASVELLPANPGGELHVVDISIGGVGLWAPGRPTFEAGQSLRLRLTLGRAEAIEVAAEVRHVHGSDHSFCGVLFVELDEKQRSMLGRYVGDLVAQGSVAS